MSEGVIVVGVDGSEESKAALRWALSEARLRSAALEVINAWWAFPLLAPDAALLEQDWDVMRDHADVSVRDFVQATIGEPHDVDVHSSAPRGTAAAELIKASQGAEMLVIGSHGHGGFAGLLLGSVSQQCAHHATCPLVIVHGLAAEPLDTVGVKLAYRHRQTDSRLQHGSCKEER